MAGKVVERWCGDHSPAIPQTDGAAEGVADNDQDDHNSNDTDAEDNLEINERCENYEDAECAGFFFINARSLNNKLPTLADAFESMKINEACVTETWFKGGKKLGESLERLQGERGI